MTFNITNLPCAFSYGALKKLIDGETIQNAVLQIMGYKEIPGSENRFRLLLNDGVILFPYAILSTSLNTLIHSKCLEKYTIFKLKNYAFSQLLPNKVVIICLDIEIILAGGHVKEKISETHSNVNEIAADQIADTSQPLFQSASYVPSNFVSVKVEPCSKSDVCHNWDTRISQINTSSTSSSGNVHICSISDLTPYQNKWTIKARVIYKTSIVRYTSRNQGKFFSFYLIDHSGEIRAIAFDNNAEQAFELIELNEIYVISNAVIKPCRENCPVRCDYEMIIQENTKLEKCLNEESSLPSVAFNFCSIDQIPSLPKDSYIDVIGICKDISEMCTIISKTTNKEIMKRSFNLIDKSKKSLAVTLWGTDAENFIISDNHVVAIKNAKISDFRGCSLNVTSMSMIFIEPKINETLQLLTWFQSLDSPTTQSLLDSSCKEATQNWKILSQVNSNSTDNLEIPLYFTIKATIVYIQKDKTLYQACCSPGCFKKVTILNDGLFRCSKCNNNFNTFNWSMLLSFEIADFSSSHFVVAFRETAENLIGVSSEELSRIKSENEDRYYDILNNLNLKSYIFKIRSQINTYYENKCLRTSVLSISPVDSVCYTKKLMINIKRMSKLLQNC